MDTSEIVIKLSKTKITLLAIGSFLFVLASVWILSFADLQKRYNPEFLKLVAYISIVLFSFVGVYGFVKLFDQKPGLIINADGILDNSSAVSGKLIKWTDIIDFNIIQVQKTKFLLIFVNNPDDYLNCFGILKKSIMKMNARIYGTPLSISSVSLNCNFDDLATQIQHEYNKYK